SRKAGSSSYKAHFDGGAPASSGAGEPLRSGRGSSSSALPALIAPVLTAAPSRSLGGWAINLHGGVAPRATGPAEGTRRGTRPRRVPLPHPHIARPTPEAVGLTGGYLFFAGDDRFGACLLDGVVLNRRVVAVRRRKPEFRVDDRVDQEREDPAAAGGFRSREFVVHERVFGDFRQFEFVFEMHEPAFAGDRFVRRCGAGRPCGEVQVDRVRAGTHIAFAAKQRVFQFDL